MDFSLTEEQELFRESIRRFLKKECPKEYTRNLDETEEFPLDLWEKMAQLGWLGVAIDEKYDGSGGDILDMAILVEELGRGSAATAFVYFISCCFGGKSIGFYGNEEQKKFYLGKLCKGEARFALALTEPGGGTDILAMTSKAALDGNDYIVNGQKMFITGAHVAHYLITPVRTTLNPAKKSEGITIFIVDAKSPGVEIRRLKKLGLKSAGTTEIFYTDVRVPKENILGEVDKGWYSLVHTLNNERIGVGALCVGMAQAILDDALDYAKERTAFGKPIGQFQAIQHYLAEMAMEIELARLMVYKAAWLQAQGKPCAVESAMAKLYASDVCFRNACKGMQIMAGHGYMMETDMQRYFRDSRLYTFAPISNEMCKNFIGQCLGLPKSY